MSSVRHVFLASVLSILSFTANAQNIMRASAPVKQANWIQMEKAGDWVKGFLYNCSAWTPSTSSVGPGVSFTQTRNCYQEETRTVSKFEQNDATHAVRNETTTSETRILTVEDSQEAVGESFKCHFQAYSPYSFIAINKSNSKNTEGQIDGNRLWTNIAIPSSYKIGATKSSSDGGNLNHKDWYFYEICTTN